MVCNQVPITSSSPLHCTYLGFHMLSHCEIPIFVGFLTSGQELPPRHALPCKSRCQSAAILSTFPLSSLPWHYYNSHSSTLSRGQKCLYSEQSQALALVPLFVLYSAFGSCGYFNQGHKFSFKKLNAKIKLSGSIAAPLLSALSGWL